MEALYRLGRASAAEVREAMPSPPTYTAVRTMLGILVDKGQVRHESEGAKYIYEPVVPQEEMARSVIGGVVQNFFGGSVERVVATLLDTEETKLDDDALARLQAMIEEARRQGR